MSFINRKITSRATFAVFLTATILASCSSDDSSSTGRLKNSIGADGQLCYNDEERASLLLGAVAIPERKAVAYQPAVEARPAVEYQAAVKYQAPRKRPLRCQQRLRCQRLLINRRLPINQQFRIEPQVFMISSAIEQATLRHMVRTSIGLKWVRVLRL